MTAPPLTPAQLAPIEERYPMRAWGDGELHFSRPSYGELVDEFGPVVLMVEESDYQGSSWVLYRGADSWGFLEFGWGSCSGCDSLEACDNHAELDDLRRGLCESVKWGTAEETLAHIEAADSAGRWYAENTDYARFVREARAIIEGVVLWEPACYALSLLFDPLAWDEDVARAIAAVLPEFERVEQTLTERGQRTRDAVAAGETLTLEWSVPGLLDVQTAVHDGEVVAHEVTVRGSHELRRPVTLTLRYPRDCRLTAPHDCPARVLARSREALPCGCLVETLVQTGAGAYSYRCVTWCGRHAP